METNKVRICQVTSVHSRYDVRIFQKIAKSVAANGYDSCVLVCDNLSDEVKDGVSFFSVCFIAKNRMDRILNSWKMLYKKALEINADIYHLHDPELLKLGIKLKKAGKKVVFDSHEDYYYKINEKEWLPKPLRKIVRFVYGHIEKRCLKRFDGLVSVTPHIVERLSRINKNTVMVTNYPTKLSVPNNRKERIICFAGGVSSIYNHDKIIAAIEDIDDVRYCIAGNIDDKYKETLTKIPGYNKVEFLGRLSYDKVLDLYSRSTLGIVTYSYCESLGGKLGTLGVLKLFEYIQCNVPMIATDFELWKPIVEGNGVGICVDPNNVLEIRQAIYKLLNDKNFREECIENCNKIKNAYSWASQEPILLEFYNRLISVKN